MLSRFISLLNRHDHQHPGMIARCRARSILLDIPRLARRVGASLVPKGHGLVVARENLAAKSP